MKTKELTQKIDKGSFSVVSLSDLSDERDYWFSKTPLEGLEAVEILRQRVYGYNPFTTRLQRVLSITKLQ
ncbi:MAG: hypothetical protein D6748_07295 [Calditrichaeota bacterium]|nr:MAG: hypothetical protein D6748_07295 [Calditrichota bacterium]